jgi:ribosomal protein S19E (S16A)
VSVERLRLLNMNNHVSKDALIGEEWMALRQIAFGAESAQIPRSVRTRLEALGLIARGDYGLMLTETGRRLIATTN